MSKPPAPKDPTAASLQAMLDESMRLRTLAADLTQRTMELDARIWQAQARLRVLEEKAKPKPRKR
jgi:hypothetical protein